MNKISLIITAGGTSSRYGAKNKLLEIVNGKTIIEYTVEKFLLIDEISEIVICANEAIISDLKKIFDNPKIKIIQGGETRQQSVYRGLEILSNPDYVLIHDGARPLVKKEDILKLIQKTKEKGAAILAVKTIDTIKKVNDEGKIIETIDRSNLYNVQTPQGFRYKLILNAHKKLKGQNFTDDAGMIESLAQNVYVVDGDYKNFKITVSDDLIRMKNYLR